MNSKIMSKFEINVTSTHLYSMRNVQSTELVTVESLPLWVDSGESVRTGFLVAITFNLEIWNVWTKVVALYASVLLNYWRNTAVSNPTVGFGKEKRKMQENKKRKKWNKLKLSLLLGCDKNKLVTFRNHEELDLSLPFSHFRPHTSIVSIY